MNSLLSEAILEKVANIPPAISPPNSISPWLETLKEFDLTDRPHWSDSDSDSDSDLVEI